MAKVTPEIIEHHLGELQNDGIPEDLLEKIREKLKGVE